jgi:hypothetical protein
MAKPKLALIPSAQGSKFYSVLPSSGVGDFDFTRSGSATRINSQGLIESVGSGVSRLNYPMIDGVVNGCPSHLLEPERLQRVQYSEDFSQSVWGKSGTSVISNTTISPDGTLNAEKITESNSSSKHQIFTSISSYTELTISFFAKKEERSFISVEKSSWGSTIFDLNNGSVVSGIGNVVYFGNGWYRCSATYTASTPQSQFYILLMKDGSTNNYQGDGVSGLYLWGVQAEVGSYATSYIPNYGTALGVTRSAETATGSGDADTFNDSEGVLMAEISALANDGTSRRISISDGGTSNRVSIEIDETADRLKLFIDSNSLQVDNIGLTNFTKICGKYKANDYSLWVNGFELATLTTSSNVPSGLDRLNFDGGNLSNDFYGNTKQLQYFDTVLTDNELETLTSWVSFQDMAESQLYTIE